MNLLPPFRIKKSLDVNVTVERGDYMRMFKAFEKDLTHLTLHTIHFPPSILTFDTWRVLGIVNFDGPTYPPNEHDSWWTPKLPGYTTCIVRQTTLPGHTSCAKETHPPWIHDM